jgi:hypothetical protein
VMRGVSQADDFDAVIGGFFGGEVGCGQGE